MKYWLDLKNNDEIFWFCVVIDHRISLDTSEEDPAIHDRNLKCASKIKDTYDAMFINTPGWLRHHEVDRPRGECIRERDKFDSRFAN